jgi:predicted Rossmann fold nucleotide-binding protein DprA/Smf involved in DNA uptake
LKLLGTGNQALLSETLIAFFASRQCPGTAIRFATDWAIAQAKARQAVISGFHSPLEQSVLQLLLYARSPTVAVLARPLKDALLPTAWEAATTAGHMAVISATSQSNRLTTKRATERNNLAAQLAKSIVVAHASDGGTLSRQCEGWIATGYPVKKLVD